VEPCDGKGLAYTPDGLFAGDADARAAFAIVPGVELLPLAGSTRRSGRPRARRRRAEDWRARPVLFLHPKDFNGTLIELEQV
jgi:hypothetical protein